MLIGTYSTTRNKFKRIDNVIINNVLINNNIRNYNK
jgi:hypothetical protein